MTKANGESRAGSQARKEKETTNKKKGKRETDSSDDSDDDNERNEELTQAQTGTSSDGYQLVQTRNQKLRQFLQSRTQIRPIIKKKPFKWHCGLHLLIRCLSEEGRLNLMRAHARELKKRQLSPM